ncbi:MAG TPA: large conductance mechanosensitive channel protein MscL [Patescibacteria group bacterium]|nr:large conductance mechanosensitive channel protein MscL [Patescibacteria group bacterium]
MFKEFKEFAVKGNAIDLAVGIVIGAAFTQVVNSLVSDVISPPLGAITGRVNFANLKIHLYGGTFLTYGAFLNTIINFVIVSFAIFLIVRQINRFRRKPNALPTEKTCPFCQTLIPIAAVKCPNCTSNLQQ